MYYRYISSNEFALRKNNLIDTVILTRYWKLSFGLKLFGISTDHRDTNIIHITNSGNYDRYPGIWFLRNSYTLHIVKSKGCSNFDNDFDNRFSRDYDFNWKTGQFHKFEFIATEHETDWTASRVNFYIDEVLIESWIWSGQCLDREANVYASDPWYESANVAMVDYLYEYV